MPKLTQVRLLQVEQKAAEPDIQQGDESEVGLNDRFPVASKDVHQQSLHFQRVSPTMRLQQGPLPQLPCLRPKQEEVQVPHQAHQKVALLHLPECEGVI